MLVTERLQYSGTIKDSQCTVAVFHLEEEAGSSRTSNVERLVTGLVPALDTSTHSLVAEITGQLPSSFGDLFNLHDRLHERMVAK